MDKYVLDSDATRRVREDRKAKLSRSIEANPSDSSLSNDEIFHQVISTDPLFSAGIYEDAEGNRFEIIGDGKSEATALLVERHFPNSNQPMDIESALKFISVFYKGAADPLWIKIDGYPVAVSQRTFRDF